MEPKNVLKFSVRDRVDDANVGLSHVPLSLIGDFQKDVADFLRGSGRDLDLHKVIVSIEEGSLAFVASGLLEAHSLWHDLRSLEQSNSLTQIDVRRAAVILRWQAAARGNATRTYTVADSADTTLLRVFADSKFHSSSDLWLHAERFILGVVTDMGGTTKPNIHLKLGNGQTVTVAASQDQLAQGETNRLYRKELLHVSAEENAVTGELRHMRLIAFQSYKPKFDEHAFDTMVDRGTQVWSEVEDDWLESFRNGDT